MDKFTNAIEKIITILNEEKINDLKSINQCLLFVISRYLTDAICEKYGISTIYSANNILADINTIEHKELYSRFYKPENQECLVNLINTKLNLPTIKLEINDPKKLKNILEILKNIDINELKKSHNLVGTIIELHLKNKSTSDKLKKNHIN